MHDPVDPDPLIFHRTVLSPLVSEIVERLRDTAGQIRISVRAKAFFFH